MTRRSRASASRFGTGAPPGRVRLPKRSGSVEKLLNERPEYFVFKGNAGALTDAGQGRRDGADLLRVSAVRTSPPSFHLIGEILDKVYAWGDLITPAARGIQTVSMPPGGSVVTEVKLECRGA